MSRHPKFSAQKPTAENLRAMEEAITAPKPGLDLLAVVKWYRRGHLHCLKDEGFADPRTCANELGGPCLACASAIAIAKTEGK